MNSKQIIFFLNPVDLVEIETFLGENKCSFFKRKSENSKRYLNYDIVKNPEKIFQVCLCIEEHKSKLFYEQTQLKEECYIDILKSYCIEFSIGGFYPYNNKELHSSRFYYVLEYFENGKLIQKDREFINWADDLFKRFKRQFLKKQPIYSNDFFSEKSIKWIKMNNAKRTTDGAKFII